jgi:hypothetical protein
MADDLITLPIHCAHCAGPVTLQYESSRRNIPEPAIWVCPFCSRENSLSFPGRFLWVAKRHDDPDPVN